MNITGIRPYEAIGQYSNYIENKTDVKEAGQSVISQGDYLEERPNQQNIDYEIRANQTETSYDYAQKYDANATYKMKGSDSDLFKLDIMNEIPKAHRDEALKQYQIFVGSKAAVARQDEEIPHRQVEDFSI